MLDSHSENAALRDRLLGELIGLARATEGNDHLISWSTNQTVVAGLSAIAEPAAISKDTFALLLKQVDGEKRKLVPMCYQCAASCGRTNAFDVEQLSQADERILSLKKRILAAICAMAASQMPKDKAFHGLLYRALYAIGRDDWSEDTLLQIAQEAEKKI